MGADPIVGADRIWHSYKHIMYFWILHCFHKLIVTILQSCIQF